MQNDSKIIYIDQGGENDRNLFFVDSKESTIYGPCFHSCSMGTYLERNSFMEGSKRRPEILVYLNTYIEYCWHITYPLHFLV